MDSKIVVAAACGVLSSAIAFAAPAAADQSNFILKLENAQLIDGDGDRCNGPNPVGNYCSGQFEDSRSALFTGYQMCSDMSLGLSRDVIITSMANGDGVGPNEAGMGIVYDAAAAYLC